MLFGAGGFGKRILSRMRKVGLEPLGFADNNPELWNTVIDGIPVYSPSRAAELYGKSAAFVITISWPLTQGNARRT